MNYSFQDFAMYDKALQAEIANFQKNHEYVDESPKRYDA